MVGRANRPHCQPQIRKSGYERERRSPCANHLAKGRDDAYAARGIGLRSRFTHKLSDDPENSGDVGAAGYAIDQSVDELLGALPFSGIQF